MPSPLLLGRRSAGAEAARRLLIPSLSSLSRLPPSRSMGGGPRTYPGGLSKWQYKRMHEKLARQKQRNLLRQEKQLYLARLRTEIRSRELPPRSASTDGEVAHPRMSAKEHIKALADRFVKAGAEDLWNRADGPVRSSPRRPSKLGASGTDLPSVESISRPEPLSSLDAKRVLGDPFGRKELPFSVSESKQFDLREKSFMSGKSGRLGLPSTALPQRRGFSSSALVSPPQLAIPTVRLGFGNVAIPDLHCVGTCKCSWLPVPVLPFMSRLWHMTGHCNGNKLSPFVFNPRQDYSAFAGRSRRQWNSSDDETDLEGDSMVIKRDFRIRQLGMRNEGETKEDDGAGSRLGGGRKHVWNRAALRNHDPKKERRKPPVCYESEESAAAAKIQEFRDELRDWTPLFNERSQYAFKEDTLLTNKRFDQYGISMLTVKALAEGGYERTTIVQDAALPVSLEGQDVLVKAKTGTGKSAAFLIPAIETVLKAAKNTTNLRVPPIVALILCPTRELAIQLVAEANVLLKYHEGIGVQSLIGGTRFKMDLKRLESNPCQILVATPGRLLDHIENKSGFSVRLMGLKLLVLDEADHLLDLGFRRDIETIVDCLPRQRQSMLFSATIPKEVRRVSQLVLRREHVFVDTVGLTGVETPTKVMQSYSVVPHELHFHTVYALLEEHIKQEINYKVMVFCTTAMVTEFMYVMLRGLKMNVMEIHSRKPQLYRTRISEEFRDSNRVILITSDVSARGMNYPDVTLVIQVGVPSDREQYIHRLGRTGREGKHGKGVLLIAPWEEYFLNDLKDLPLEESQPPDVDSETKTKIEDSIKNVDGSIKEAAYHAWLGYYNSITEVGRDKTMLVELASMFSHAIGLEKPPTLFRRTALKMGLKDIPGIRLRKR